MATTDKGRIPNSLDAITGTTTSTGAKAMSLKEIKAHDKEDTAVIAEYHISMFTEAFLIAHKDRGELIRMVEQLQAKLVEIKALLPKWYDIDDDFASICADELQAILEKSDE